MTITELHTTLQYLFTEKAAEQGKASGWEKRKSPLTSEIFVQTVVFGCLENPHATLNELARMACRFGAEVTGEAICERFTPQAEELLKGVLQDAFTQVLQGDSVEVEWLQRFSGGVYLNDSTQIAWHDDWASVWDGGGIAAAVKLPVCIDMLRGGLQVEMIAARKHDSVTTWPNQDYPANSVVIEDLGYLDHARMKRRTEHQVYSVIPYQRTIVLKTLRREPLSVLKWLQQGPKRLKERKVRWNDARYRLIAIPVTPESAARRREHIRKEASEHQKEPNPIALALADWVIVLTTLPLNRASSAQVAVLMRLRWQIELVFKLWKDQGKLDESRGYKPARVQTELYAKLLGLLVQHWLILTTGWAWVDRSLVLMGQTIREEIRVLCHVWSDLAQFTAWCKLLTRLMWKTARISSHIHQPSTASSLLQVSSLCVSGEAA